MTPSRDHALVVGGSLAGLLAARVLSDHFQRVTVVERDVFPSAPGPRPGIGQAWHLHVLWTKGLEIVETMFPGLEAELLAAGVPEVRIPRDVLWLTPAGWRTRFDTTRLLTFTRGTLDHAIRGRLSGQVAWLQGHEVTGLLPGGPDGKGVAGVRLRERGVGPSEPLEADLVVDATGRTSRAPAWLAELSFPVPNVTTVDSFLGYASRYYRIPDGFDPGWKALFLQPDPPRIGRGGGLFPQEGGRWIVSLGGAGRDYPPTGEREFLDFAKGLRSTILYETIRSAEPLTRIRGYRQTANHRLHYERLPAWPDNFLVMGDAVCAFNPIYAQGMTVAALEAVVLDSVLEAADQRGVGRRFQGRAAKRSAGAWMIATGEDSRYPETDGAPHRLSTKIINHWVSRVIAVADVDPDVCRDLLDVLSLATGPFSLVRPTTAARVLTNRTPHPAGPEALLPQG